MAKEKWRPPKALENLTHLSLLKKNPQESGLFFDLDGTLTEIVDDPAKIELDDEVYRNLKLLASIYGAVALVSGRAAKELERVSPIPHVFYVGNHGLEIIRNGKRRVFIDEAVIEQMRGLAEILRAGLPKEGIFFEDKELSLSIHYREAPDKKEARKGIFKVIDGLDLSGLRIKEGKMLVQLRPHLDLDKGRSVEFIVKEEGLAKVLYAGDDTTDLDAFRSLEILSKRGYTTFRITVGDGDTPSSLIDGCDFYLQGIAETKKLLRWLAS